MLLILAAFAAVAAAQSINGSCPTPLSQQRSSLTSIGHCAADLDVIGENMEVVHEHERAPTGLGLDLDANIYFTYARNLEAQNWTLTKSSGFNTEVPWPSAEWQNCASGQNVSECFVNVLLLYYAKIQLNDIKVNKTLGTAGYAFFTDDSSYGSITTIDLDTGATVRHIFNSTFTRPDPNFISMYNGQVIRNWSGTTPSPIGSGSNGIALSGGNLYWGVKASNHWYFASQEAFISNLTDSEIEAVIQNPENFPSEQAGFTADDHGRVYICASSQNAILYADTMQSEVTEEINGVAPGGSGMIPTANHNLKTFARGGQLQAADTMAIMDGYLYFTTNQQGLSPARQYNNVDKRKGPFRSYRTFVGRGPA